MNSVGKDTASERSSKELAEPLAEPTSLASCMDGHPSAALVVTIVKNIVEITVKNVIVMDSHAMKTLSARSRPGAGTTRMSRPTPNRPTFGLKVSKSRDIRSRGG